MLRLIWVLLLLLIATIFAVQNSAVLSVTWLAWQAEASLAVVIAVCFAFGAMAAAVALVPGMYRRWNEIRTLRARVARLEAEVASVRAETSVQSEVPT
jgi:uncharacterized integral membrane protein